MRGGLSAIQQTLTPEAASVLSHSIAEAGRRNHGQTTPLHVAATLLASPTGFLRQACIRSHPNSSHPLQCRALELCFSVALERLPTAQNGGSGPGPGPDPPISNALMAALKRAQAHQRRGCPEQQQQPLLAVKVELEQLIISILDDPSVSRVMREASFSSPAVKAAIEQLVSTTQPNSGPPRPGIGLGFRPGSSPSPPGAGGPRNLYLNPRLQQQQQQQQQPQQLQQGNGGLQARGDDVKKVMDILSRSKKRNPILVGESGYEEVAKEVLRRIDKDEIRDEVLKGVEVVSSEKELGLDRDQLVTKVKELGLLIERKMVVNSKGGSGVIVDLGDLKWLVDQPPNQGVSEAARGAVMEMGKIMRKCGEGGGKIWFIGAATCETYLRCQVYHPSWENEWDLQVVSIVARPPLSGIFSRFGSNGGILSSSVECLSPMRGFPMPVPSLNRRVSENFDPSRRLSCCPQCTEKYDQEYARLVAGQSEKPSSEAKSLPPWLQNAKPSMNDVVQSKEQDMIFKQKTQELQKKWKETCLQLHPSFHNSVGPERITPSPLSMTGLYNPNLLGRQPFQPKLQQPPRGGLGDGLQLNISSRKTHQPNSENLTSKPGSPVRTELVLGPTKTVGTAQDEAQKDGLKDLLGCISSESAEKPVTAIPEDADSFKRLLKGLIAKVWWQTDAASTVAAIVTQCRSGNGKRRAGGSKGDVWMLFSGPDRIGKKKLAAALSELVCDVGPILFSLGSRHYGDESDLNFRGKTVIDRIVEAVRRNPFSVIMLQDIDEADMLVRGSIKRAMDRGRISDSHGREISLGNVIFIVTSKWMPDQLRRLSDGVVTLSEEKMVSLASGGWQLKISVAENANSATTITGKRSPSWRNNDDDDKDEREAKQRKEELGAGLSFDLNQVADTDDDRLDGSHNSSDLTVEHEEEHGHENRGSPTTSSAAPNELLTSVDEAIFFKVVDFKPIRENIERSIITRFSTIVGETTSVKIDTRALEKILSGIWLGKTSLESWLEKVVVPSINQLKTQLPSSVARTPEGKMVVRLELDQESESRNHGDWLPGRVSVVTGA